MVILGRVNFGVTIGLVPATGLGDVVCVVVGRATVGLSTTGITAGTVVGGGIPPGSLGSCTLGICGNVVAPGIATGGGGRPPGNTGVIV